MATRRRVKDFLYLINKCLFNNHKFFKGINTHHTGRSILSFPVDNETVNNMDLPFYAFANPTNTTTLDAQKNCTKAAILEFPSDGFTRQQRKSGWVAIHVVIACYCFWLLAIVCDDYFVDAVKAMCSSKYNI